MAKPPSARVFCQTQRAFDAVEQRFKGGESGSVGHEIPGEREDFHHMGHVTRDKLSGEGIHFQNIRGPFCLSW